MHLDMAAMPPRASVFTQEQWDFLNWMCTFEKATMADVVQGLKRFIEHNPAPDWIIPRQAESFEDEVSANLPSFHATKDCFWGQKWRLKSVESLNRTFQSVIDLWLRLKHPNVLQLYGACDVGDSQLVVCEYAQSAVDCAIHACGIVHGDVSPNNILVSGAGTAKLASFVLSSPQREIEPEPTQSGSSSWTSPAFCCGHRRSFASDVFWFGKMIFELVSGSIATNNIDFRCDICSAIDLPPQPAVFTDDEWELVLDTCKGGVTWLTLLNASLALLLSMQQLMRSSREIQGSTILASNRERS
ncbi:Protein kinase-like domain [Phytophthora cactorum]|nr:Protein kinase-like domain [Phytophthora cactorum]